jgi:hypothetical protein
MSRPPRRDAWFRHAIPALLVLVLALTSLSKASAQAFDAGRQVTVFGVLGTPGNATSDPKLKEVLPQLNTTFPGYSFRLLKAESKRVLAGQSVSVDLGEGFVGTSQLVMPIDPNGKIPMRFDLYLYGISQFQMIVASPPNQLSFVNQMLPNGNRLIIGIGAR